MPGFVLTDEQQLLQDQLKTLLADRSPPDVLRTTIDSGAAWDQGVWQALAELGVLGAGIPEEFGGVGLGPTEVAIVAREVGRAVAPVPFFSSICLAAEAIMIAGTQAQKAKWLPGLASGEVVATFAFTEGPTPPDAAFVKATLDGGKLTGVKTPVADAAIAQVCVVVAKAGDRTTLALVELNAPGVALTPLKSVDELRKFAQIDFAGAPAEAMDAVDGDEALQQLLDRAAVYGAFEQIGGAEAALYMARDYVLERKIFGRPLGSYQGVKHRLAEDLANLELAIVNALQAADVLASGKGDVRATAATARISATTAYETLARDNLQFHGGIGFTWVANCHFHYRRARTLALALGSVEFWSERLIKSLETRKTESSAPKKAGSVKPDTEEDAAYRAKAAAWLAEHAKAYDMSQFHRETAEGADLAKRWYAEKHKAGYSAISQPVEFGGAGGTRRQESIFEQEEIKAGVNIPMGGAGYGQFIAAIRGHGTPEQRKYWESETYKGNIYWAQLFSEPGAGSDLANVRTKAEKRGDKWIVNGQKVWTSGGHLADYGILVARTDPEATKHAGLSFFLIDMRQPGVTTRPIRQINGQTGFTETFLDNAEVPDSMRLDDEGKGWAVAMTVLAAERTTTKNVSEGERRVSNTSAQTLIEMAKAAPRVGGSAFDSSAVRLKIAQFHVQAQGIKNFTLRLQQQIAAGQKAPTNIPVIKLVATNRIQQVQAFLMDLDEAGGVVQSPDAPAGDDRFYEYITSASSRIAGGADEVLKNQLAERALNLPGDLRADKDIPFSQIPV